MEQRAKGMGIFDCWSEAEIPIHRGLLTIVFQLRGRPSTIFRSYGAGGAPITGFPLRYNRQRTPQYDLPDLRGKQRGRRLGKDRGLRSEIGV
jgi:hypothetical protein